MIEAVDAYEVGDVDLGKLCSDLKGLLGASDLHDLSLIDEFWNHFAEIDMECELRTEGWAHPGSASDERLRQVLRNYKTWVADVLASASNERT